MKNRIQKLLVNEKISPTRFAEIIGVQRSSISHILSGRNKPSFDVIQKILENFPHLNPDWLLLGNGEIYRKPKQTNIFDQIKPIASPDINEDEVITGKSDVVTKHLQDPFKPPENKVKEKKIERVVVFYKDKTFTEYIPEQQ